MKNKLRTTIKKALAPKKGLVSSSIKNSSLRSLKMMKKYGPWGHG